jgi:predicted ATP-binding protein involved in virulence
MEKERTKGFDFTLEQLTIDNFRGFGNLEVPFDKDMIVFIAENGGGKTTILDAIAECLKIFMWQLLKRDFTIPPSLDKKNIKNGTSTSKAQLDIKFTSKFPVQVEDIEEIDEIVNSQVTEFDIFEKDYSLQLSLNQSRLSLSIDNYAATQEDDFDFRTYFLEGYRDGDYLPLILYYGCNSVNTIADTNNDVKEDEIYHIYYGALEPTRFSFQSFFQWFDTQYKISHIPEKRINKDLEVVCQAIEQMFNEDMNNKVYQNLRMDYQLSGNDMVIDKKNSVGGFDRLDVTQMSSGEKMIFAMVADISKRLILANPDLDNPLEGKGIVLIDEIDLHLHPKWQRRVLVKLREIFPKLQFIVTTHSPFVLQSLKPENISLQELSHFQIHPFDNAFHYGRDANAIAYSLQGVNTRIPEVEVEIKKMYDLIDKADYNKAKLKVNELSKYLSEFDEDIIKARTFIEFYTND